MVHKMKSEVGTGYGFLICFGAGIQGLKALGMTILFSGFARRS
jgi:hypothetical protein